MALRPGFSFDGWIHQERVYGEISANAVKRVVAGQLEAAAGEKAFSMAEMAPRMQTSQAALDRLLDPENRSVTLPTLHKAAAAIGREVRLELV